MEITSLSSNAALIEPFAELPHRLYEEDPNWVPPPPGAVQRLLGADNPFFNYGALEAFVAWDGDRPVGRVAAIDNPRLEREGEPVGLIGFFEAENRYEITEALLTRAIDWLARRGRRRIWGPMNFSMWHSYRMMTRGFDATPFFGEPYNPPHYPEHFERFGFSPIARYYSWDLGESAMRGILDKARPFLPALEAANEGYRIEPLNVDRFQDEVVRIHGVLNESFATAFEYSPITARELQFIFDGYERFMIPELAQIVVSPEDEPVGYLATYPDVAPMLRAAREGGGAASTSPDRVILHTMVLKKAHRRRYLIERFLVPMAETIMNEFGYRQAVGALAREGPTIYDSTGDPSRAYALYGFDAEAGAGAA